MIGQVVSHYRIVGRLGEGGMGSVYLAEDLHLGRSVAIKLPVDAPVAHQFRARFLREARAASSLNHPNIASVYDYGETSDGRPFIVMELIKGQTLNCLIDNGRLSLPRAIEIMEAVSHALSEAHAQGVIHRDIKPSNIIINERGEVKVLDFGLAKNVNGESIQAADPDAATLPAARTQSGIVVGTPLYLSPEQALGMKVDPRSDLFATGTVLYESIAGRPPFTGKGMLEIAAQIIHVNPPPPSSFNPHVSRELDRIALKALAKKPEERYQTADELIADLESVHLSLLEHGADQKPTRRIITTPQKAPTSALTTLSDVFNRPRLSVGVFLLIIALLGGAVWSIQHFLRPKLKPPTPEAKRWYDLGTTALREGTYFKASKAFEQALAADSNFALAHARLGEAWMELDYSDKAKNEIIQASSLVPDRSILPAVDAHYLAAISNTFVRNFTGAIEEHRKIVEAAAEPDQAAAYFDLGRAYERNEDFQNALNSYVKATELDSQFAAAFLRLGVLYGRKQDLPAAAKAFERAAQLYRASSNFEGVAEVSYQQGVLNDGLDKLAEAKNQFKQTLETAQTTGNLQQQIKAKLKLSSVLRTEGDSTTAQQYANEVIDLARANGLENLTTNGLIDLGYSYFGRGDFDEAEKQFRQALTYAQANNGRRYEARALLSLASLSMQRHQDEEAVRYVEQAMPFYREGGYRRETAQALQILGRANRNKGNYEAAVQAFGQQLEEARRLGDKPNEALSAEGLGVILSRQGRYPEALSHFETSKAIYSSLGHRNGTVMGSINTASMLWNLGRYSEARGLLNEVAKSEASPKGSKELAVASMVEIADAALTQNNFNEAKSQATQAIALAGSEFTVSLIQAKRILGIAQALSGSAGDGATQCKQALDLANQAKDPWLISTTQADYAQVLLEKGDAQNAVTNALEAEALFEKLGQQELAWRVLLVAARASSRAGEPSKTKEYATRSSDFLKTLEKNWGAKTFQEYLNRPDIQTYRRQLDQLLASNR
ncbi:MAG TPA: tetratricopeptide repeat protein [Pyrinomonadaceae bacterium]|nr:tetratricopeptide repeat protein [Pyrinomonadaceae bacterium]